VSEPRETPPRLFKYVHPDRIDVLHDGCIRFTPANQLNDLFDLRPFFTQFTTPEFVARVVEQRIPRHERERQLKKLQRSERKAGHKVSLRELTRWSDEHRDAVMDHAFHALELQRNEHVANLLHYCDENYGVLCLAEEPDNMLMWAHYAAGYRGLVLEFATDSPFFERGREEGQPWGYLAPVSYRDSRPAIIGTEAPWEELFLVKSEIWRYEREWRVIRRLKDAIEVKHDPAGRSVHLLEIDRQSISGVIMGSRAPEELRQAVRELLASTSDRPRYLREALPDEREYRLNIVDL